MKKVFQVAAVVSVLLLALGAAVQAQCVGDCDDSGDVVVSELITGINIALGSAPVESCPSFDSNGSGDVTVDELVTAINNALTGCPPPTGECGNGTVDPGEECDDGNTWGGDGCAANCTTEVKVPCTLSSTAGATLQTSLFAVPIPISGSQALTVGKASTGTGEVPAVIRADEMVFNPVSVPGLVCACVRGGEVPDRYGPGNAASGLIGCGSQGLKDVDYLASIDHNTDDVDPNCENGHVENGSADEPHAGVCNGELTLEFTGDGPQGSAFLDASSGISLIQDGGACAENCAIADNGPDCIPCTADDLNQAEPSSLPLTTGTATGEVFDANNQLGKNISADSRCGASNCKTSATGALVACSLLESDPANAMSGSALAGALASIDTATIADNVVTVNFSCE